MNGTHAGHGTSMTVTEHHYDVSAARLFAILVHPETYPEWLVGAKDIREVSSDWPRPGSFFKHTVGFGPIKIPDTTSARAVDGPHMLEMLVRARPLIEAVVRFEIASTGATSCQLTMTETPAGPYKFVAPLTQPLIRARNERSLDRLEDLVVIRPGR